MGGQIEYRDIILSAKELNSRARRIAYLVKTRLFKGIIRRANDDLKKEIIKRINDGDISWLIDLGKKVIVPLQVLPRSKLEFIAKCLGLHKIKTKTVQTLIEEIKGRLKDEKIGYARYYQRLFGAELGTIESAVLPKNRRIEHVGSEKDLAVHRKDSTTINGETQTSIKTSS